MTRRAALAGSLALHAGALAVVVFARAGHDRAAGRDARTDPSSRAPVAIELVSARAAPASASTDRGGGSRSSRAAATGSRPDRGAVAAGSRPARAAARSSRRSPPSSDALGITIRIEPPSADDVGAAVGDVGAGDVAGGDLGAGGSGHGIGRGAGGLGAPLPDLPPLPTPEPASALASRTRPPQLIYPVREREVDDELLYVARLTIDRDGFVVGARLVRGAGGGRDEHAASAVWRFRYRPALDDDGRPTSATIDQRFLVE